MQDKQVQQYNIKNENKNDIWLYLWYRLNNYSFSGPLTLWDNNCFNLIHESKLSNLDVPCNIQQYIVSIDNTFYKAWQVLNGP